MRVEGVAAMDGGHVAGVIKEVGADGAQRTDRHDDWSRVAEVAKETATLITKVVLAILPF